jgi:hypothetical protein
MGSLHPIHCSLNRLKLTYHTYQRAKIKSHMKKNIRLVLSGLQSSLEKQFNEVVDAKIDRFESEIFQLGRKKELDGSDLFLLMEPQTPRLSVTLRQSVRLDSYIKLFYLKLISSLERQTMSAFSFHDASSLITPEMTGPQNQIVFRRLIPPSLHIERRLVPTPTGTFKLV